MPETIAKNPVHKNAIKTTKLLYPVQSNVFHMIKFAPATTAINYLSEAPVEDKIYQYGGQNYARPQFRLIRRGGTMGIPESDAFWFSKDEQDQMRLNLIIEAYREEVNVMPLDFRGVTMSFMYHNAQQEVVSLPLEVTETASMRAVNVLKHIHAHTLIEETQQEAVYRALTDANLMAGIHIEVEIWWQQANDTSPDASATPPAESPEITPKRWWAVKHIKTPPILFKKVTSDIRVTTPLPTTSEPQKVMYAQKIRLHFDQGNQMVFGGFFSTLESKGLTWQYGQKVNLQDPTQPYFFYFRPTHDPDTFFFLPQVFRLQVNESTGLPKIGIAMYKENPDDEAAKYRINITLQIVPYFHPKAKKDLLDHLFNASGGKIKYISHLLLGGFKSAAFRVNPAFQDINAKLAGTVTETLSEINPSVGFTLSVDTTIESFGNFKKMLLEGFHIGDIIFQLEQEKEGTVVLEDSKAIPVELDLKKLGNIPVHLELIPPQEAGNAPVGVKIKNTHDKPLQVEGIELTLLSVIDDYVYDVDYTLSTDWQTWPLALSTERTEEKLLLKGEDIKELSGEDMAWNSLICEPHGVRFDVNGEIVMEQVIDYASSEGEQWDLQLRCPLFEGWNTLTGEEKAPYEKIINMLVEVKDEEGAVKSVELSRDQPKNTLRMTRSLAQLLKHTSLKNRTYEYRQKNIMATAQSDWSDWQTSESTGANFLYIYPKV